MHFSTFSVFGSLPFVISNFVMPDPRQFMLLMLISLFGSLGQVFITYAYRFAPASEISIYNYSGILFSIVLGAAILGEPVKSTSILGGRIGCDCFDHGVYLWEFEEADWEIKFFQPKLA